METRTAGKGIKKTFLNEKQQTMQERNQQGTDPNKSAADAANRGHGAQGIDKAPGEETAQDNVQFSQEAFKGKKVDADPSKESDRPDDQDL